MNTSASPDKAPDAAIQYPPLEAIMHTHVDTITAAHYLMRKPQTLRTWASLENGPLRPRRFNRRLAWSVEDIKRVLKAKK